MSAPEASPGVPISDRAAYISRVHFSVTVPMVAVTIAIFSTRFYLRICFSIAFTVFWLTVCQPLSDWWDLTNDGHNCADTQTIRGVSITGASLNIVNNVLLSIAPVTFLWSLHRPAVERILVCALMGIGSFASVASIIKLVLLVRWTRQPEGDDLWAMAGSMNTWSVTEQFFAVMATCLPFLKPVSTSVEVSVTDSRSLAWYRGGRAMFGRESMAIVSGAEDEGRGKLSDFEAQVGSAVRTKD
ncbi:hypothetical protein B0T18DRAFT_457131 [Schizothecium vesticola]|uniref:Rhodopsin domain-containing protein n=1 Tax=Schizothecium vesticola TaxID=314040 RepID=A0AA40F533_9PEZI|nr:hypothetical protein B0T18DRAFT_457131 [Schizothecium vesticola]